MVAMLPAVEVPAAGVGATGTSGPRLAPALFAAYVVESNVPTPVPVHDTTLPADVEYDSPEASFETPTEYAAVAV